MSNSKSGFVAWAGIVLALLALGAVAFQFMSSPDSLQAFGVSAPDASLPGAVGSGGPSFNAGAFFPKGFVLGNLNSRLSGSSMQITRGLNKISWKNTTGGPVVVKIGDASLSGTASSTFKIYVGTTTSPTVTDTFATAITAPFWSQFIDGAQVATGSPTGVWADNIANHKSGLPSMIRVEDGQYLTMAVETFCKTSGSCETATSTNRGWTTLTLPFLYAY